jgi:replicative DNA helicase
MHKTQDPALEEIILSHIFSDPSLIDHRRLRAGLFSVTQHRKLFELLRKLRTQGEPLTADAVAMLDADSAELAKLLSLRRLGDVTSKTVIAKLCDMERRRSMQDVAAHLSEAATDADDPAAAAAEQLSRLMAQEDDGEDTCRSVGDVKNLVDMLEWRANNPGRIRGLSTGFAALDRYTDGLHPGLITLAARPTEGKSTLLLNIALNVAEILKEKGDSGCVYFGNYEMSSDDLQLRAAASLSGYPIDSEGLTNDQMAKIGKAIGKLRGLNVVLDEKSHPYIDYVVNRIRKMHREKGVRLAAVDYAQLVRASKSKGDKVADLDKVSKSLQALGMELKIPILAAAQLKRSDRQWDKKEHKWFIPPPSIDEVKGCGSFEEDSYCVWMIHRDQDDNSNLMIGKNRHGPRDKTIRMNYSAATYTFREATND